MENNIVDFNFKTYPFDDRRSMPSIKNHYQEVFNNYFKLIKYKENVILSIYNLKYSGLVDVDVTENNNQDYSNNMLQPLNQNGWYQVELKDSKGYFILNFYIYSQNNCCGAMTCSGTNIDSQFIDNKLATICQYIKQDIAIYYRVTQLICTDVYSYGETGETKLDNLKPYLPNTKVLLNTGWEASKLFFNKKSNNVVGIFTKDIPVCQSANNYEVNYKNSIDLKIKLNTSNRLLRTIEDVTIGCDPELFLRSKDTQEFVPSFYVMKGDKNNPTPISDEGHNIQCDNVMVEYGIPPCKTAEEFVKHNLFVQEYIKTKVAEPNDLEMVIFPTARFTKANLKDDRALHMGCDPDYNAFLGGKPNTIVRATSNLRTGAGHIHVGYKDHNYETNMKLARIIDTFISIPLILMEPDNDRKTMYGKAGAFRHQPWGVEVRTTSNYIFSSPELMEWAFNQVKAAIDFYNNGTEVYDDVQTIINTKNTKLATRIMTKFGIKALVPSNLATNSNN